MTQPDGQIVGRTAELDAIERAVAALRAGTAGAVAIAGEPGMGKTRLLEELAARADTAGSIVLRGSASEFERDVPFWAVVEALDEYVAGIDPDRLELLEDDVRAQLADVLPSLARHRGRTPASPQERYRTHRAVRALLALLSDAQPLAV